MIGLTEELRLSVLGVVNKSLVLGVQREIADAQAESFFSRFKAELVTADTHQPIRAFKDLAHARQEAFSYIEGYYNRIRLHSSIGYLSPIEFERELKTKSTRRSTCQTFVSCFS